MYARRYALACTSGLDYARRSIDVGIPHVSADADACLSKTMLWLRFSLSLGAMLRVLLVHVGVAHASPALRKS